MQNVVRHREHKRQPASSIDHAESAYYCVFYFYFFVNFMHEG